MDGTLRLWDTWSIVQKLVIKPKIIKRARAAVTACSFSTDGQLVAASIDDGSIQLWDIRGKVGTSAKVGLVPAPRSQMIGKQSWSCLSRTEQYGKECHSPGKCATGMVFSTDGTSLVVRSLDDSLHIWDLRNLSQVTKSFRGMPNDCKNTQAIFSPGEELVVTGTTSRTQGQMDSKTGTLCFIDRKRLSLIRRLGVGGSAIQMTWHSRLNQLIFAGGNPDEGFVKVLYKPEKGLKGALTRPGANCRTKAPSEWDCSYTHSPALAICSNYGKPRLSKNKRLEILLDKAKSERIPVAGSTPTQSSCISRINTFRGRRLWQYLQNGKNVRNLEALKCIEVV